MAHEQAAEGAEDRCEQAASNAQAKGLTPTSLERGHRHRPWPTEGARAADRRGIAPRAQGAAPNLSGKADSEGTPFTGTAVDSAHAPVVSLACLKAPR